jgi:putative peptide zinc metalloprotease protein
MALLSEHWHAVRHARLSLRDGVQVIHRRLRGRAWVLLADPVSQRFHRLTPQVWSVVRLLDGQRSLDEVWAMACELAGKQVAQGEARTDVDEGGEHAAAITQTELVQLMSTLHGQDLLRSHTSPDATEVHDRHQQQRRQRRMQSWLNPMSMRLPLLHPDPWFERQAPLARALFTWPVLCLWLALVLPMAGLAWQHLGELTENLSDRVLSASNLALLWLVYPLVKAVHECAHGMAVKAWGGRVREMGLMFILFTPVPYVDASASYRFHDKWARAAVAAAGVMAELALGALALLVWLSAQDGVVRALAYNVVLIAGVSTLLINGNPLMRYDGYFVLCDLLEVPNLAQRAGQYRRYLLDRFLFGSPDAQAPIGVAGERKLLLVYGLLAPVYQLTVTIGVIWFVLSQYLLVGALMALMAVWSSLVMPVWRGWQHLRQSSTLARRRGMAARRAVALLLLALALITLVPVPFHAVHQGVLWLPDEAIVRAQVDGHVRLADVQDGQSVSAGQTLVQLDNPRVVAELQSATAQVAQAQVALRQAQLQAPAQVQGLQQTLASRQLRWQEAQQRWANLTVVAGMPGRWTQAVDTAWAGRHVKRGDILGYTLNGPARLVRVAVTQDDMDLIRDRLQGLAVRPWQTQAKPVDATLRRLVPGGEVALVSAALGTRGGGDIAVDPSDAEGRRSLARVFDLEVALSQPVGVDVFGGRADVRFDLGRAPLLMQMSLRLRQTFLSRLAW